MRTDFSLCHQIKTGRRWFASPFLELSVKRAHDSRAWVAAALLPRRFLLLFLALFAQDCFAREPYLIALDGEHLDEHLVAQF